MSKATWLKVVLSCSLVFTFNVVSTVTMLVIVGFKDGEEEKECWLL